jgi:hypothetical protein
MHSLHPHLHLRKASALMAAVLILPALAFAGHDNGKGNDRENNDRENNGRENNRGDKDRDRDIPVVPEASAGWVLIPFVGAVLLFSWRRFSHAKA